jgi:nicotinamidase/pyrazinamidase
MAKLFLGIDWEEDFIRGSLAVPGAEVAERSTANFMISNGKDYAAEAFSEDFHPANHCSFKENGGPWPRHCEAYTIGSAISPLIVDAMHKFDGDVVIITKGEDPDREEYSLFRNEAGEEQFQPFLQLLQRKKLFRWRREFLSLPSNHSYPTIQQPKGERLWD